MHVRRLLDGGAVCLRRVLAIALLCLAARAQSITSVAPAEGTIGTTLVITGSGFGTAKPKAWLSQPGVKAKTPLKVQSFGDGEVTALLTKGKPGTYDVSLQPKGKGATAAVSAGAFALRAPEPLAVDPACATPLATVTLSGRFFGPKKGSAKVGGLKAKVLAWLPAAAPDDDDAVQIALPKKLPDGTWHVQLKTKVASVTSDVLVSQTAAGDCAPGVTSRPDDLWPPTPAFPDAALVTLTPLGGGLCAVAGAPGSVGAGLPVYVASPNSANDAFTTAAPDGSFSAQLIAPPASWVIVKHDPTGGSWLFDDPNDLIKTPTNAAPGILVQVPFTDPPGAGEPFSVAGSTFPARVDFVLAGHQTVTANSVALSGTLTVFSPQDQTGNAPVFSVLLHRLADAQGHPRCKANQLYSTLLTPTGLPIEHWEGPPLAADALTAGPLAAAGAGTWQAPFSATLPLPPGLPDGTYAPWLSTFGVALDGALPGERRETNHFTTNHELSFAPFTVGAPQPPRLALTLLTDVPSADGSRGVVAQQDAAGFGLTNRIATQAGTFIVPRSSRADGSPLVYSLEPFAPMVSQGERRMPDVPTHDFLFPSGSLAVTVTRPDAGQDVLGPQPFRCGRTRSPTSSTGVLLDNGGGNLDGVLQISTNTHAFDYAFPAYGDYLIDVVASIDDVHGNSYAGGGTYAVTVAEPLDIEPGILPMTPLTVGDSLAPALQLLPGVPADVTVHATLMPDSDAGQAIELVAQGTADRFGVFAPGGAPLTVTAPGELLVETTARWLDGDGVLWAGATRWGQVVASAGGTLVAHGRRGIDDEATGQAQDWYTTALFPSDAHAQLPYHSGDTLWQGESEAARIQITVEDTGGAVQAAMQDWVDAGKYASIGDHSDPPPSFAQRAAAGELPLCFATAGGENAAEDPEDVVAAGYWYAGIERPGERVREMLSDDDNGTAYWRYGELYGLQPGLGVQGDLPGDFKFQFGGAVFRDDVHGLRAYAGYASLWLHLPEAQPARTDVWPPFFTGHDAPFGGALLEFRGQPIDGFVVPLAPRPGAVLETGQTLSFSAQIAPPLPSAIDVQIAGPGGFAAAIAGRADAVGFFHDPAQSFVLAAPGRYHFTVTATLDAATSGGPAPDPPPIGSVLGAVDGGFDVYVVDPSAPALPALLPPWSVVQGSGPVELRLTIPPVAAVNGGTLHYTIATPGWLLQSGAVAFANGQATITYAPGALAADFPNLDLQGRAAFTPGLADTVWIGALLEADDGGSYAASFTLQGADLFAR